MIRMADIHGIISRDRRTVGLFGGIAACLVVAGLFLTLSGPATAALVKTPDGSAENDPRMVFGRVARAWENGDQQALADLVHETGLKVTSGGNPDRTTHYSPSQAFYYFKNVFQTHRTMIFFFEKTQDASGGDRVHGMAVWKRRRPDSDRVQELKLVCVLARQGDRWMLSEINTIR